MSAQEIRDELLRLELALASRDPTDVDGGLMSLIAEDFVEFGQSGRVWVRRDGRWLVRFHQRTPRSD